MKSSAIICELSDNSLILSAKGGNTMQIPRINVRIHPDDLGRLRILAKKRGVRISDLVRLAIQSFLEENDT